MRSAGDEQLGFVMTFCEFGACVVGPQLFHRVFSRRRRGDLGSYLVLSSVVLGSVLLANSSLRFVAYPIKVVFKSCKLIPTMVIGAFMLGKRFTRLDVASATLVCTGLVGISLASMQKKKKGGGDYSTHGVMMLAGSICLDAIAPNLQERLMSKTKKSGSGSGSDETI